MTFESLVEEVHKATGKTGKSLMWRVFAVCLMNALVAGDAQAVEHFQNRMDVAFEASGE